MFLFLIVFVFVCWQTKTNPLARNVIISPHCKQQARLCVWKKQIWQRQKKTHMLLSSSVCGTLISCRCLFFCLRGNWVSLENHRRGGTGWPCSPWISSLTSKCRLHTNWAQRSVKNNDFLSMNCDKSSHRSLGFHKVPCFVYYYVFMNLRNTK